MSGLLETMAADIAAIKAHLLGGAAASVGLSAGLAPAPAPLAPAPLAPAPLAAPAAPVTAYPTVTAEQITALITPHVGDPNLKASLQQQMAAMGIAALPDAQPHQYGELYARFQQVIAQFAAVAAAPAAAPASII